MTREKTDTVEEPLRRDLRAGSVDSDPASVTLSVVRPYRMGFGCFDGLYEPGYLDALRAEERA